MSPIDLSTSNDMTNQEKPRGLFLERQNNMIEIHLIGPRVKKKRKGCSNNKQHKDKVATDGDKISIAHP